MLRTLLICVVIGLAVALVVAGVLYRRDMQRAYDRITDKSLLLQTDQGQVEYTDRGAGPPVLVIHGSGGGFDNGELLARAALDDSLRWITPSRLGYLRSTMVDGATFDDQAHVYAHLLDHLGLRKVAVVALSHGGPGALLFATLYPERVSSLTLISAGVASSDDPQQAQANRKGDRLTTIFRHDLLYWSITKLFRHQLIALMGADAALVAALSVEQRQLVDQVIDTMNPVAPRAAGAAFDNRAEMPNQRIAAIRAPTLIFHARDDGLQLFRHAEFAAQAIPGARLVSYDRGGHLLLVVEQATIRAQLRRHILAHVDD
jgi:pimeloyl-ACP methyl ester carboxylesterase